MVLGWNGLENRPKYQFLAFFDFFSFLVMTQFLGCDTACLVATVSGQLLIFLLRLVGAITSSF